MQRPRPLAPWPRHVAQLGLLAGLALALANGAPTTVDAAPMPCQEEASCSFKKPLFAFILDYSSSMNEPMDANQTRWQAANTAISQAIDFDNGYIAEHFILALIRFGHDPDPNVPGTKIATDTSGLVDGQKLDVPWYDPDDPQKPYRECSNGDAIVAALAATDPPSGGNKIGIGSWTRGALDFTANYIATTKADHPQDMGQRPTVLMLLTDGPWQSPQGNQNLGPANQSPNPSAAALFTQQGIPTYVVAFGDAFEKAFANDLALAGGTATAFDAESPQALIDGLKTGIIDIQTDVVTPACAPGVPRIMVLLDASSSMLNINGGTQHAPPGMGGWDQIREALAGSNSMFDVILGNNNKAEDQIHVGLAVFGHNNPGEQKLVVQYGSCRKNNIAWALDPATSCEAPGCLDPYGGPPITWTFLDGSMEPPAFADKTLSHMPRCDFNAQIPNACVGSGTFTHLGLNLVHDNITTHRLECSKPAAVFPCNDATLFLNILITDGKYNSTDAQVQLPLAAMLTAGVTTHVIGFGPAVDQPQLAQMADWGSGALLDHYHAQNQDQLELVLKAILEGIAYDPCCTTNLCLMPDPDPNSEVEGDPIPSETTSTSSSTTADTTTAPPTTTGATTTDSTTSPVPSTTTSVTTTTTTTDATTDPTTPVPTSTPQPTTPIADTSSNTGPDESAPSDRGCACDTRDPPSPLAPLLTLALVGLTRRRPRLPSPRSRAARPAAACRDCARSAPPPPARRAPRSTSP